MTEYIKRKDAIEALGEEPYVWSDTDVEIAEHAQWVSDVKAIEAVPSADVRPVVRGGWEEHGEPNERGKYELWYYSCTRCGAVGIPQYSFCPNCGADMRGRKNERTD